MTTIAAPRMVRPESETELARALRDANEAGLAVIPRGSGARQYVGNAPARADLILDTTALTGIVEHNPADLTVTARAGTSLADLQTALGRHGQRLALDPPHATGTLGGLIATDGSGPRRQRHGTLRDLIIGTRVALADGTVARAGGKVVKNVAGYDTSKLYIGSLGTLAVVTEVTFKVLPLPVREAAIVATFPTLRDAIVAALALARAPLRATALEAQEVDGAPRLSVVAEGEEAVVKRVFADAARIAREYGAGTVDDGGDVEEALAATRRMPEIDNGILLHASLPIAAQPAYVLELRRIAIDRDVKLQTGAHAGVGVVRVRFAGEGDAAGQAAADAAAVAKSLDGDAWVERVAEPLRAHVPDVWYGEPAAFFLMRRLKREFDPNSTLNPGRFVGGI